MNRYFFQILILLLVCVVSYWFGYRQGRSVWVLEGFKTNRANLLRVEGVFPGESSDTYSKDLKDYIRGRYYYFGNRLPQSYLPASSNSWVSAQSGFTHLSVGKGPTSAQLEFERFKKRIDQ